MAHLVAGMRADDLLAGMAGVWAVTYSTTSSRTSSVVLRLLGGSRSLRLAPETYPVADTDGGLVVWTNPNGGAGPSRVLLVDHASGRVVRTFGTGRPLAAHETQLLMLSGACDPGQLDSTCTIVRIETRTGQVARRYRLPAGRVPVSGGALSGDGRLAAFGLTRSRPDPAFDAGHPIPPSDVVLLHLDTGRLDEVPGLELAPKSGAGLAIAPGGWVLVTVSDGDHSHLVAWRPGLAAARDAARLPGPVAWTPPVLLA